MLELSTARMNLAHVFIKDLDYSCWKDLQVVTVQGAFLAPLVVLSFRQLVVWAVSADRAAGILSHLSLFSPLPYMSLCSTPRCE